MVIFRVPSFALFPFLIVFFFCSGFSIKSDVSVDGLVNSAGRDWVPRLGSGFPLSATELLEKYGLSGVLDYQIGDEWGKKRVDPSGVPQTDAVLLRSVNAAAMFNSATSFYIGRFSGHHLMATNHHVLDSADACEGRMVNFTVRKKKYRCREMIGTWSDIDFALFVLEPSDSANTDLSAYASEFDFSGSIEEDTRLLTAGYGIAGNSRRDLMVNENSDCRVLSGLNEFRFMADPDQFNPAAYRAWSFATGCGVSHGDSGSAIVSRNTGKVIGLVWTGAIPKETRIQNSRYIRELQNRDDEDIWTLLTYAVPAQKIKEKLEKELAGNNISPRYRNAVQEFLLQRRTEVIF
jgi:hypothetical protein